MNFWIHIDILTTIDEWTLLSSLKNLKISRITSLVYKTILTVCPNLVYLELSMFSSDELHSNIQPHMNLKRLIIDTTDVIFVSKITASIMKYDWLASKIALYLLFLRRFTFYFKIVQSKILIEFDIKSVLDQIEENFLNNHNNRYQSRLVICEWEVFFFFFRLFFLFEM